MKPIAVLTLLLCVFSVSVWAQQVDSQTTTQQANSQQTQVDWGAIPYDDFNHKWLDPTKWAAVPDGATPNYKEACYFSTNVLECVREIQDGKLRLAVRSYGARDSNEGTQYGESKLFLTNQLVKSITAEVVVRSVSAKVCPANPGPYFAAPQAMIAANFFNNSSGDQIDYVTAYLTFQPSSPSDLRTLIIRGFMYSQGQASGFVDLGSVPIGTPLKATVRWNQSSHRFTVSFVNLITHQFFTSDIPYTVPDTMATAEGWKGLYVQVFPSNCVGEQTFENMEATFDNVIIERYP